MYYTKEQLLDLLERVFNDPDHMLYGEQCGGGKQLPSSVLKNYADATGGKLPAILGIDLACYGLRLPEVGEGSELWKRIIAELKDYASQGGIITASSHFANPTGGGTYGNECRGAFSREGWDELFREGSEINKFVTDEIRLDGRFLKELDDAGIPVLWRPLHEVNGGWFWFGGEICEGEFIPPEYMKRFWRMIYDIFTVELGMKHLIWVYSPNVANWNRLKDVLYYYPGDDMCDIVGVDWYTDGKYELNSPAHSYDGILSTGKIAAITEFCTGGEATRADTPEKQEKLYNSLDMLETMKTLKRRDGLGIAYVLTWCGGCGAIPWLGKAKEATDDPFVITLDRLREMYI